MLARLFGKSDIYNFKIEIFGDIKTFDFLKVEHHENGPVLTQVINITRDGNKLIGDCKIIGFRENNILRNIRTPFMPEAKIEQAEDSDIEKIVGLNTNDDAFLGVLEHHPNLRINLDLKKTITKHIAVLAKSGAGKSYTVGVLLEEIIKKNIPIIILDPHNEYSSLKYPNTDKKDLKRLEKFGLQPEGFLDRIKEFSPNTDVNPHCEAITLDINSLKPQDLIESLPQKLTPAQQSLILSILSNMNDKVDLDTLIFNISNEESNTKWSLISLIEQLKKLKLYSSNPTPLQEIVKFRRASIISLKGVEPYVQETLVAGLLTQLFEARKREEIPPFFLVLEEAHNFCPEASLGKLKSSKIIRTLAGEGRKFGIGLCVISQRPAKVDKNVISQCTTQMLLKITNPNDLRSVISSSEGVDTSSENEIQKLNIGTSLLTGVIDIPLKINVRPRISKHGGETVDITLSYEAQEEEKNKQKNQNNTYEQGKSNYNEDYLNSKNNNNNSNFNNNNNSNFSNNNFNSNSSINNHENSLNYSFQPANSEYIQFVAPEIELEDAKVLLSSDNVVTELISGAVIKFKTHKGNEVNLLFDKHNKQIIKTIFPNEAYIVSDTFSSLSVSEKKIMGYILELSDTFNPAELLLKTDVMFNEILKVCDNLASKGILRKTDRQFQAVGLEFIKKLDELNFYGNQKFEEIKYDKKLDEKISNQEINNLFSLFGQVLNIKDIYILNYSK